MKTKIGECDEYKKNVSIYNGICLLWKNNRE